MFLALTDEWQTTTQLAEVAGISVKGAGTVLLAPRKREHAERRVDDQLRYVWRRAAPVRA
jgi:hypothetical protein